MYMKHLESSYTNGYLWAIYMGKGVGGGESGQEISYLSERLGRVGCM